MRLERVLVVGVGVALRPHTATPPLGTPMSACMILGPCRHLRPPAQSHHARIPCYERGFVSELFAVPCLCMTCRGGGGGASYGGGGGSYSGVVECSEGRSWACVYIARWRSSQIYAVAFACVVQLFLVPDIRASFFRSWLQ